MQIYHDYPEMVDPSYRTFVHSMLGTGGHYPVLANCAVLCPQCPRSIEMQAPRLNQDHTRAQEGEGNPSESAHLLENLELGDKGVENEEDEAPPLPVIVSGVYTYPRNRSPSFAGSSGSLSASYTDPPIQDGFPRIPIPPSSGAQFYKSITTTPSTQSLRVLLRECLRRLGRPLLNMSKFYFTLFVVLRPAFSSRLPRLRDVLVAVSAALCSTICGLGPDLCGKIHIPLPSWLRPLRDLLPASLRHCLDVIPSLAARFLCLIPFMLLCYISPAAFREEILMTMSAQGLAGVINLVLYRTLNVQPATFRKISACLHPLVLPDGQFCGKVISFFQ